MNPCIAIIDPNTLCSIALHDILSDNIRNVEIHSYGSMDSFIRDSNRHFIHFFVSNEIFFRHVDEFETLRNQTTVMSEGDDKRIRNAGYNVLDISLSENEIISRVLRIQLVSRYEDNDSTPGQRGKKTEEELSSREKEVLRFMIKGLINKEIAEQLGISVTTVIFHRNNICEKLHTRSLGRLTIFAVLSGIIDINEI
ncbi:MAG: helix-turn-helix transcriptional regulator [Bacteroidales bacterium]|nr:helix-turn-helix transcriptional regulator [Bacteroidales bacterium]